jgi:hypothetical protein
MKYLRILLVAMILALTGCATNNSQLKAPCPNFGAMCHKTPINSWNYSN